MTRETKYLTRREKLQIQAENIKMVEIRICELMKQLRIESDPILKRDMQDSLKTNRKMLQRLREEYWKDEVESQVVTRFPGL